MDKIQLVVLGLSASPANNNAYALILKEVDGPRRLPIIIGAFEAQAIALEMEGVTPPRPMTHDLLKNALERLGASLTEVYINELKDGTFYARLIFDDAGIELDSRPSDAIALAVRSNAPIYVHNSILDETGLDPQADADPGAGAGFEAEGTSPFAEPDEARPEPRFKKKPASRLDKLQNDLDKAVKEEDYELAANIRDEIQKILESS